MVSIGKSLPIVLLGLGVAGLVAAGICYQATGGGEPWCPLVLGIGTVACIAAFALAMLRRPEA